MSKLEEKATDAWAVYEYREHPKGLYHTCFVDGYRQGYEQAEKDIEALILKYLDSRNERDYSTVGWIKKHFGEYKKEIMEEE